MNRVLLLSLLSLFVPSFLFAQSMSKEEKSIRQIIKFRDNFVSTKFDQKKALKMSIGWREFECNCEEAYPPPPTLEEVTELRVSTGETSLDDVTTNKSAITEVAKYTSERYFTNDRVFNIAIFFDTESGGRILAPFSDGYKYIDEVNRVIEYIKKNGKKTGENEYFYRDNYFRMGGIMNTLVEHGGFYVLEKKFYPSGFVMNKKMNGND